MLTPKKIQQRFSIITIFFIWLLVSGFSFFSPSWESIERQIKKDFPEVQHIGIDELNRALDQEKIVLIDVRDADEFAISQIKGAQHIQSPEKVSVQKQSRIVVYCSVGYRSADFVQALQERGFQNVVNLRGSIFAWANSGYPVYKDGKRAYHVHPYNKKWGRLLNEELHLYP